MHQGGWVSMSLLGASLILGCQPRLIRDPALSVLQNGVLPPANLSYTATPLEPFVAYQNSSISDLTPSVTGSVESYAITPALPSGLSLNPGTGVISGTPTSYLAPLTFTVTASNTGGSTQATFSLVIGLDLAVNATTDQGDSNPGNGLCDNGAGACTLRAALQEVSALRVPLRLSVPSGTITLALGEIPITTDLALVGNELGGPPSVLDGNNASRIFNITAKTVSLQSVILQNGNSGVQTGGAVNHINPNGKLSLTKVTIQNSTTATADRGGGAVFFNGSDLSLSNSRILGNSATVGSGSNLGGGGVYIDSAANVTVATTTFDGNSSPVSGGAVFVQHMLNMTLTDSSFLNNTAGIGGGGAFFDRSGFPRWTIRGCLFQNNSAVEGRGGALFLESAYQQTIENSTFYGNSTSGVFPHDGGAIFFLFPWSFGPYPLINYSTFIGNSATGTGGAVYYNAVGPTERIEINNSIFGANVGGACGASGAGMFFSKGYNLESANTCGFAAAGDQVNTDPQVVPGGPANHGGPTLSIALQPGSPALNAADPLACIATDQRGVSRPLGGRCDIGAYEF